MVAICRGGDGCDCEEYDPPADPNVPSKCQECGHGKSKHPKPSEAPAAPAKTKKSVLDIFQSKTAKTLAQAIPVLSSRTSAGVGYAEAREESLKGYREDEKGRPKPGATKTSKKPDDKAKGSVQIAKVILLPCGSIARRNGQELREDTVPTGVDIAHMKNHGCVASNIQINPDWTHEECTQRFTHLFPEQFAFAHENAKSNDAASWSLVSKERQRVRCVPEGRPVR
ncbi:hypothetical protein C8R46DRAFT_1067560 [Mycena filopes]|nr:hypothetical protein C8R46DRAFT_1067560 [Mycena filopes]